MATRESDFGPIEAAEPAEIGKVTWTLIGYLEATMLSTGQISVTDWNKAVEHARKYAAL